MPVTEGNVQQKLTYQGKFPATGRNFLPQDYISCHRKKCSVIGRNFLPNEEISCHMMKFYGTAKLQGHSTKYPVTGRSFLPQEVNFCYRKKFPVPGRNFL